MFHSPYSAAGLVCWCLLWRHGSTAFYESDTVVLIVVPYNLEAQHNGVPDNYYGCQYDEGTACSKRRQVQGNAILLHKPSRSLFHGEPWTQAPLILMLWPQVSDAVLVSCVQYSSSTVVAGKHVRIQNSSETVVVVQVQYEYSSSAFPRTQQVYLHRVDMAGLPFVELWSSTAALELYR